MGLVILLDHSLLQAVQQEALLTFLGYKIRMRTLTLYARWKWIQIHPLHPLQGKDVSWVLKVHLFAVWGAEQTLAVATQ